MLLFLSVSKDYFKEDLARYLVQSPMSRETVIYITPEQFLKLAEEGYSSIKEERVKNLVAEEKDLELPYLGCVTRKGGDLEVAYEGGDHEGRHRMRALQALGVKLIPVRIVSKEHGEGPAYRWGKTDRRPSRLFGHKGYSIPFPETHPYGKAVSLYK